MVRTLYTILFLANLFGVAFAQTKQRTIKLSEEQVEVRSGITCGFTESVWQAGKLTSSGEFYTQRQEITDLKRQLRGKNIGSKKRRSLTRRLLVVERSVPRERRICRSIPPRPFSMKRARALAVNSGAIGNSIGSQSSAANELVQILPDGTTRPFLLDTSLNQSLKGVVPISGERTIIGFTGCTNIYSSADPSNPRQCSVALLNNPDYLLDCILGCETEGKQALESEDGQLQGTASVTKDNSIFFATRNTYGPYQGHLYRYKDGKTSHFYQFNTSLDASRVIQVDTDTFAFLSYEFYNESTESRRVIVFKGDTLLREITVDKWAVGLHPYSSDMLAYRMFNLQSGIFRLNWQTGQVEDSIWLGNSSSMRDRIPIQNDIWEICNSADINDPELCSGKMTGVFDIGNARKVVFNLSTLGTVSVWEVSNDIRPIKKFSISSSNSPQIVATRDGFFLASGAIEAVKFVHYLDVNAAVLKSIQVPDSSQMNIIQLAANKQSNIVWIRTVEGRSIQQRRRLFQFNADTESISEVQTSGPDGVVPVD